MITLPVVHIWCTWRRFGSRLGTVSSAANSGAAKICCCKCTTQVRQGWNDHLAYVATGLLLLAQLLYSFHKPCSLAYQPLDVIILLLHHTAFQTWASVI